MEVKELERRCCVVEVSEAFSPETRVSCSGVIIDPERGTVICAGVPFSRFITDASPLPAGRGFLSPCSFSEKLRVGVGFSCSRSDDASASPPSSGCAAELLLLVDCPEFKQALRGLSQEPDQWRFYGDQEDEELLRLRDLQFLSWFAVLKVDAQAEMRKRSGVTPWRSSSDLQKGLPVVACGSPFGALCSDLFIGTLSGGIVSNLAGQDNAVILTDARCLPGTEGGGLFAVTGGSTAHLAGLIVSPFGWKAREWIGLALVCSVHAIFRSVSRAAGAPDPPRLRGSAATAPGSEAEYPTVCLVDSGPFWGTGVLVTSQTVVTCRHVVDGKPTVTLTFHIGDRVHVLVGDVLFSTRASSPFDLALVRPRGSVADAAAPRLARSFNPGDSVLAVGYGGSGRGSGPSLTCGILSKAICLNGQPVMLQTTCAVHAGSSGGAVVRRRSGELLGIVSSNTRDFATEVTYPHLNFIIPVTVFQGLLQRFHQTNDIGVFTALDTTEQEVRRVWRLQGVQSKM
ncbi:peroxisomal leader peptide-processing protease [Brachionichthys hirsutus]|uniref:peroxisomal leader peptide-processing protease n=1 Tax=Brachionichthys hirsutus TaxID=412623 RepID=UPI0036047FD4